MKYFNYTIFLFSFIFLFFGVFSSVFATDNPLSVSSYNSSTSRTGMWGFKISATSDVDILEVHTDPNDESTYVAIFDEDQVLIENSVVTDHVAYFDETSILDGADYYVLSHVNSSSSFISYYQENTPTFPLVRTDLTYINFAYTTTYSLTPTIMDSTGASEGVINIVTGVGEPVVGCTDPNALNYDPSATEDEEPTLCEYGSLSVSPNPAFLEQTIVVNCSVNIADHGFVVYNLDEEYMSDHSCTDGGTFVHQFTEDGSYYFLEYSVADLVGDIGTMSFSEAQTDLGYIGEYLVVMVDLPLGNCPADEVCYHDWLLMNSVIIFLLSLMSMGFIINFFPNKSL